MIVINCDNVEEIEQAKKALDDRKFGLILMENAEEWSLIRTALEFAWRYMYGDDEKEILHSVWKELL